jgi:site-specific recombinase XerD
MVAVFNDYVQQYAITDVLFPYTRHIERLLKEAGKQAKLHKHVTASMLRDTFVVRSLKRGAKLEEVLERIGLSISSWDDAGVKYGRLVGKASI